MKTITKRVTFRDNAFHDKKDQYIEGLGFVYNIKVKIKTIKTGWLTNIMEATMTGHPKAMERMLKDMSRGMYYYF